MQTVMFNWRKKSRRRFAYTVFNAEQAAVCIVWCDGGLAFDNMIPVDEDIMEIISLIDSFEEERIHVKGVHDPREYLISAMSLWKNERVQPFLNKYTDTPFLKTNVEEALKQNKTRFEY